MEKRTGITIGIDTKSSSYLDFLNEKFKIEKAYTFDDLINSKTRTGKIDLLVFTGGADVHPSYYNEHTGKFTHTNEKRDELAFKVLNKFKYSFIPKLGICRGAQFLTVASNGGLIQHVENHTKSHLASFNIDSNTFNMLDTYYDNGYVNSNENTIELEVTSTHHQMMNPFILNKEDYELIAFSTKFQSSIYLNGENENHNLPFEFLEPEIVYYKHKNALAIQYHPEFINASQVLKNITLEIINNKLMKNA